MVNLASKRLLLFLFIAASSITQTVFAGAGDVEIRTTTDFEPPKVIGMAVDGAVFPGKPYIGCEVIEVRIYWDVVVPRGYNAADIKANVILPIVKDSGGLSQVILDGSVLGWSGSGTFNHVDITDRYNFAFGPEWTRWGWQATGLPRGIADVLATSRIEIDYIVPEPATIGLLVTGAVFLLRSKYKGSVNF